jgi:hypothetical protein
MNRVLRRPLRSQAVVALLLASTSCASHPVADQPSFAQGHGRFVWTDSMSHQANRPAYHTRCGSVVHVWVRDTLSPLTFPHMIIGILDFEGIAHAVPVYPDFARRFPLIPPEWADAGLYLADDKRGAVLGQLRLDSVTADYIGGQVSGRLVWHTRWDQKPDTSGTLILDFRAPRRRTMEQYLCNGPRM